MAEKEKTESLWETLLDLGLSKALGLIWIIYVTFAMIALFLVHWFTKHK